MDETGNGDVSEGAAVGKREKGSDQNRRREWFSASSVVLKMNESESVRELNEGGCGKWNWEGGNE